VGRITRPQKTGGTTTYVEESELGHTDIIDLEVDEDLRTIYDEFNGHIGIDNLDPGIIIPPGNVDLTNYIKDVHVNTAAAIQWTKIAHPTYFPIDPAAPLPPFSTTPGVPQTAYNQTFYTLGNDLENGNVIEATWTSKGGPVLALGVIHLASQPTSAGTVSVVASGGGEVGTFPVHFGGASFIVRIRWDATPGYIDGVIFGTTQATIMIGGQTPAGIFPTRYSSSIVCPCWGLSAGAGSRRLKLTLEVQGNTCTVSHVSSALSVVELA
jgi:hypothetical protein